MPDDTPSQDDPPRQLPDGFSSRMRELLGAEAERLLGALALPPVVGLRLNPSRGPLDGLLGRLPWSSGPVPWCGSGRVLAEPLPDDVPPPGLHPYEPAGVYYLQDPAAMLVAAALAPEPGDLVIDLAAAPGGKSTHLASLLGGTGWLVANDVSGSRARRLLSNLERWGARNATVTSAPIEVLAGAWPGRFDRVLLDAPCSGEGMFRKSEDALAMWSAETVASCAARQNGLIDEAAKLVRPGGLLAYSTCTFAPEENEWVIDGFLRKSGFELVELRPAGASPGRPDWLPADADADAGLSAKPGLLAGAARVWPHVGPGEGHFVAVLRRPVDRAAGRYGGTSGRTLRGGPRGAPPGSRAGGALREAHEAWLGFAARDLADGWAEALWGEPLSLMETGDWLAHAPLERHADGLALERVPWLRHGLQLGQLRRGKTRQASVRRGGHGRTRDARAGRARLEPAHALAMALPGEAVRRRLSLPWHDPRLGAYLSGDGFPADAEPGYVRVEVDGFPLGWGRSDGSFVRSLLPKGLRRR